jgi:hypothetical protein
MIRKIMPLLLAGLLCSCGKHRQEFHDNAITPSIAGVWRGTVQINNVSTVVTLTLQQQNALVKGVYAADGASAVLGESGSITGATTGPAFSLDVAGDAPACLGSLKIGGENSGTELSFNLIGSDCNNVALRGESFLDKQS